MKKIILLLFVAALSFKNVNADRIYIMNSPGYNIAPLSLINAIIANGHTVVVNTTTFNSLPAGFTTTCIDSINGYDYLCFFGNTDFTILLPQIQTFVDNGGKVFYQYEVSCCTVSSDGAAAIASGLTGLSITPNVNGWIGFSGAADVPGWEAVDVGCCNYTFAGNAYKGMDGLPVNNQLQATATVNGGTPAISACTNFGFVFTTTDFLGSANQGAMIGIGDVNMWFDGGEPLGSLPINTTAVDFFFPGVNTTCYLLPPGCMTSFSQQAPVVTLGNDTSLCQGQSLTLNASTPGVTYLWQDNSTGSTLAVSQTGTYWVQVSNGCGIATDSISVIFNPAPAINLGADTTICQGQAITLFSDTSATNIWSNGLTTDSINVNVSGIYWVQSSNGSCSVTDSISITVNLFPVVELGNDTTICQGQTITLNGDPSAVNTWSNGSGQASISVSNTGLYSVISANGLCSVTDSVTVTVIPFPGINLGSDITICQGDSVVLNGDPLFSNLWSTGSTNASISVSVSGIYWLQSGNGLCISADTIVIGINQYPVINLGNDTTICQGQTLILSGDNSATNSWSTGVTANTISVSTAGIYSVVSANGQCIVTDSISLSVNQFPVLNLGNDMTLCEGQPVILTSDNAASSVWSNGSTASSITVTQTGTYWVAASIGACTASDTVSISFLQFPSVNLGNDTVLCQGETLILNADNSASNNWSNGSTSNSIIVSASGNYWLQSSNGQCSVSDSISVSISDCEVILEMPNVLTPNNDGKNDSFIPIKYKGISSATLKIFNRWGEELFSTSDIEKGWDGSSGSSLCTDGTYFWILQYRTVTNKSDEQKGFLTLIK